MSVRLIRLDDASTQPWRNGGGVTRELLAGPGTEDWRWRISVADIERDGPFSSFPGVRRWFVPIEGVGVELVIDGQAHVARLGDEPLAFDGAAPTTCRLLGGPTRDLNLMLRGADGGMRRVVDDEDWSPASAECGLFTAEAGVCRDGSSADAVPAGSLVWWAAAPTSLRFTASAGSRATPGWWLFTTPSEGRP
jgi:environmental stress-induced protein Ves